MTAKRETGDILSDQVVHDCHRWLNSVRWNDFDGEWSWYYAESELYVVKNRRRGTLQLVFAKNPQNAIARAAMQFRSGELAVSDLQEPIAGLRLAMGAGARAIENTRKYRGTIYCEDVFSDKPKEIPYLKAAQILRQGVAMLEGMEE